MFLLSIFLIFLSTYALNAKSLSKNSEHSHEILKPMVKENIPGQIDGRCLDCICQVESNCNHSEGCKVDANGEACGPYHIHQGYFQDCCHQLGDSNCDSDSAWRTCALDYNCATRCVQVKNYCCNKMYKNLKSYDRSKSMTAMCRHIWTYTRQLVIPTISIISQVATLIREPTEAGITSLETSLVKTMIHFNSGSMFSDATVVWSVFFARSQSFETFFLLDHNPSKLLFARS